MAVSRRRLLSRRSRGSFAPPVPPGEASLHIIIDKPGARLSGEKIARLRISASKGQYERNFKNSLERVQ